MPARIRILPENLCNKIAAGEVVERPASVVKELVENALDADATDIGIEIEGGGKRLIRITDNGTGMGRDDLLLSVERHATSKIASDEDLFRLQTLGFRGEALPSIAAVSRLNLRSRPADEEVGWEVYLEGGVVRRSQAAGLPPGTSIEVRNLFFNTPARRKFLRRDETELGHIGETATRLALACPEVRFRLQHNQRTLFDVPAGPELAERVGHLLGRPLARDMLEVRAETEAVGLHGLIAPPAQSRSTGSAVYTFINGRFIRDRVVQHAVFEGYRHLLMKGRYPVVVLFLDIDPALVDVNVHPTKHEVRFREQRQVHEFIADTLRRTLAPASWVTAGPEEPAGMEPPAAEPPVAATPGALPAAGGSRPGVTALQEGYRTRVAEALGRYAPPAGASPDPSAWGNRSGAPPVTAAAPPAGQAAGERGFFRSLRVIGQFRHSYILCEDEGELLLIDQHAAHERIGFERLRKEFRAGAIERQMLLFPEILELDFREGATLAEHLGDLERLGFEVEPFGGQSFALKAVPQILAGADGARLVRDVSGELAQLGNSALLDDAVDEILIKMACHGMVRANQALGPAQISALLEDLDEVDFRGHCPHGRPVLQRLSLADIERLFKRT